MMLSQTALRMHLPNRQGELDKITRQLANAGVNIRPAAGVTSGGEGQVEFLVDNPGNAITALTQAGTNFDQVRVAISPIPQQAMNQPGTLARLAEKLAAAGINIESFYPAPGPTGEILAVLGCSDPEQADHI